MVLNADQAMPLGGAIDITASNREAPGKDIPPALAHGRYVTITVRDSGPGIPQEYLAKIFDPYFTTKEKGSGLGLATSYSIVRNHGGIIEVSSEEGRGTLFTIYLPAADTEGDMSPEPAESPAAQRMKILVMDDEEVVRNVACELIRALGHEVDSAAHGEAAVQLYRRAMEAGAPFDLVILDLTIRGGMGGLETLRALKQLDPAVMAAVSSGYSDDASMGEYRQQGFIASLKKPYAIEGLQKILNELMRESAT
jgi:CheY-like chemotaxis protein